MNDTLIERIDIPHVEEFNAERIICSVMGKPFPEYKTITYYKHVETGHEFLFLVGAFAVPGFDRPGFALVAGYDRHPDKTYKRRLIRVIDEYEAKRSNLKSILKGIDKLRKKYAVQPLLNGWHIDVNEQGMLKISDEIHRQRMSFYPEPGPFWLSAAAAREYLKCLVENIALLDRGNCNKLRGYMERGPQTHDEALSFKREKNPALIAAAVAVTVLMVDRPWTWEMESHDTDPVLAVDENVGSYVTFDDAGLEF